MSLKIYLESLKSLKNSLSKVHSVVIYSGRFQPFHLGHYKTYQSIKKKFPYALVLIATSDVTNDSDSPLNFEEKKSIISKYPGISSKRIIELTGSAYDLETILDAFTAEFNIKNFTGENFILTFAVGAKDEDRLEDKYYSNIKDAIKSNNFATSDSKLYKYIIPKEDSTISLEELGIKDFENIDGIKGVNASGTNVRAIIKNNSDMWKKLFPKTVHSTVQKLLSKISGKNNV